jgi:hypothetical protein
MSLYLVVTMSRTMEVEFMYQDMRPNCHDASL